MMEPKTRKPMNPTKEETTMEMTYTMQNGLNLPDLMPPEEPEVTGKYAMLRERFLKEQRPFQYLNLLTSGTLNRHLLEIQESATAMLENLLPKYQAEAGLTEELKARNPLRWTGLMNNLKHSVEETILSELVYA